MPAGLCDFCIMFGWVPRLPSEYSVTSMRQNVMEVTSFNAGEISCGGGAQTPSIVACFGFEEPKGVR